MNTVIDIETILCEKVRNIINVIFNINDFDVSSEFTTMFGYKITVSSENDETIRHLIGRFGRNATLIRSILNIIAKRNQVNAQLFINSNRETK